MFVLSKISELIVRVRLTFQDTWAGIEQVRDGFPHILRFRPDNPFGISQKEYDTLVSVKWNYSAEYENGMPSPSDHELMFSLEKKMSKLEYKQSAFLMTADLGNGQMEWQLYSRNEKEVLEFLDKVLPKFLGISINYSTNVDPDWADYYRVVPKKWLKEYRTGAST